MSSYGIHVCSRYLRAGLGEIRGARTDVWGVIPEFSWELSRLFPGDFLEKSREISLFFLVPLIVLSGVFLVDAV